jgi:hypothetical protein
MFVAWITAIGLDTGGWILIIRQTENTTNWARKKAHSVNKPRLHMGQHRRHNEGLNDSMKWVGIGLNLGQLVPDRRFEVVGAIGRPMRFKAYCYYRSGFGDWAHIAVNV